MRIAFISSEAVPFAKTGGLADVSGALTKELARRGHDVTLFLPGYEGAAVHAKGRTVLARGLNVPVGKRTENIDVAAVTQDGVRVCFIEHAGYFCRPELYRDPATGQDWADNDERFILFSRGVLEACAALSWYPEIVHANDWQSALVPAYLGTGLGDHPAWQDTRSLFTVHNIAYQGLFPETTFARLGIDPAWWYPTGPFEYWGKVNFLKLGFEFAESLSTVSARYAEEIAESNEYGFGMEGILTRRRADLVGIVNGIDYDIWNPEIDPHIPARYSAADLSGKAACKAALQKEMGLPTDDVPLIGIISRLADQKGFDLIDDVAEQLMTRHLQIVVLGTGDKQYHDLFTQLAARYPDRLAAALKFDNGLAHRIEAGADLFLMPSRYEPCGLNQLYSLRYGTIPVVRATGGLADTVAPYRNGSGTGFRFEEYTGTAMLTALDEALATYGRPDEWRHLVERAMAEDFSWPAAASAYEQLYRATLAKPRRTVRTPAVP